MPGQLLLDVPTVGCLDEQHVLQQVRHSCFAIALMPRSDKIGHVDRDLGVRGVRKQQHAEAVWKSVLGDALDRGSFLDSSGRLRERGERQRNGDGRNTELTHAYLFVFGIIAAACYSGGHAFARHSSSYRYFVRAGGLAERARA